MTKHTPYSPGDPIKSSYTNDDIDGLSTGDNDTDNNSLIKFRQEALDPFFKAGGTLWSISSGRVGTMNSGVLYYDGQRIPVNAVATKTFTASKDTYVDVSSAGVVSYKEATIGDTAPVVDPGKTRLAIITTDASNITSIYQKDRDNAGNLVGNTKPVAKASSTPRISLVTTASSILADVTNADIVAVTALAENTTIAQPAGTPANGQGLMFRIKDNGTGRTLNWNGIFRPIGVTLPSATVASKTLYVACRYNTQDTKWDVLSVGRES